MGCWSAWHCLYTRAVMTYHIRPTRGKHEGPRKPITTHALPTHQTPTRWLNPICLSGKTPRKSLWTQIGQTLSLSPITIVTSVTPAKTWHTESVGIPKYKCFFNVILYVINLFDIEIDIKIRFIFFIQTVFLWDFYGGHNADLIFHIIISEFQCIILDSSPKKISWCENMSVKYIYWAHLFILGAFIYSVRLCNKYFAQLD